MVKDRTHKLLGKGGGVRVMMRVRVRVKGLGLGLGRGLRLGVRWSGIIEIRNDVITRWCESGFVTIFGY